jgi:hypothetical protein
MDLLGRRIAGEAGRAWRAAGERVSADLPLGVRWTRPCYCGQEVEPGRRVSATPVFGVPFLGGSEDGASIFHEPLATEGRRLPAAAADPVHGRKIVAAPSAPLDVHEERPEVQVLRIGDRLLLAAPGEPSVEMGRRFEKAVAPHLPAGIRDVVVVGLSNDYLGYLTTPEEYEMQHYEGGHTVFGTWTSLLARDAFVALTRALATGTPAPAPTEPGGLGSTDPGRPDVGGGGPGRLLEAPRGEVERMSVVDLRWSGAPNGADRPVDAPFVAVERRQGGAFTEADSDLGLAFSWREADGEYRARYDVPPDLPAGTYRARIRSGGYDLRSEPFEIVPSDGLRPLGVTRQVLPARKVRKRVRVRARTRRGARRRARPRYRVVVRRIPTRTRLVLRAQHPPPDPARAILHRDRSPSGGRAVLRLGRRRVSAPWSARDGGWVAVVKGVVRDGTGIELEARALRDGAGNTNGEAAGLRVGELAEVRWPPNMGVGGGRTPGVGGQGEFPP